MNDNTTSKKLKRLATQFYDRHWLKMSVIAAIICLLGLGWMIGSTVSTHQERHRAEQAEKRLSELRDERAAEIQRLEVEFDLELERRIKQAKLDAQAEMAEQLAALNQQLEEEQQAYADLEQAMNDLERTYQELMDTVFGPGWNQTMTPPTDPLEATAMMVGICQDFLDRYFPAGLEPHIDIYLGWRETYPEGYANLIRWGGGEEPSLPLPYAMQVAAEIAYDGYRWDTWIEHRLGPRAYRSPYYGRGPEYAYYLWKRGRPIENALATLEAESTYGLGGSIHFGILYGGYPNTIEGYCDLLDTWSNSNDPWAQACFWNMPGYPRYQQGFIKIVEAVKGWRP